MKSTIINKIETAKIVAIIRSEDGQNVRSTITDLVGAGISVLEITANTPQFLQHISWARSRFPEILVGAGTVITTALAEQSLLAGAQFLVTPNMDIDVINFAKKNDLVTLMGAMTPTDIAAGINNGADFIKIFPAAHLGIAYFKMLLAPFKGSRFIAVGGINLLNAGEWLDAGAVGVGVGGSLTNGPAEEMKKTAENLLALIEKNKTWKINS